MNAYVTKFNEKELDSYNPVAKNILVDICLHGMIEDYRIYLKNLSFSSFSRLMEPVRWKNRTRQKDLEIQFSESMSKKKLMIVAI